MGQPSSGSSHPIFCNMRNTGIEKVKIGENGLFFPGLPSLLCLPLPCSKYYEKEALLMDPVDGPILASLLGKGLEAGWASQGAAIHTHPEDLGVWKAGGLKEGNVSLGERKSQHRALSTRSSLSLRPQWVLVPWSTLR